MLSQAQARWFAAPCGCLCTELQPTLQAIDAALLDGPQNARLTHGLQLVIEVQLARSIGLDGSHVQAGPKGHHQEQGDGLGGLAQQASQVDAVELYVLDVVQLVQFPEGLPWLHTSG